MTRAFLPAVTYRAFRVWQRDADVYRKIWKISFLPPFIEPLFYLLAFGVGFSGLVGDVGWEGLRLPYVVFITPALIAANIMNNAFFETTYASFVRMYYQKTFDAMLATPLTIDEVITGEILWGATKSVIAAAIMLAVISPFGLVRFPDALLVLPCAILGGLAFASLGMFFTGLMPSIETFNLPIFLLVTPMFLLSGTFFPLENLPSWAQAAAWCLPLTHLTSLTRAAALGHPGAGLLGPVLYLAGFSLIFYPLALRGMRRRLIK